MTSFSTRHGLSRPDAEITIRQNAPSEVRDAVATIAYRCSALREGLCGIRYRAPDKENWSEVPNIDKEVRSLMAECEWFEIYDFVEAIASRRRRFLAIDQILTVCGQDRRAKDIQIALA